MSLFAIVELFDGNGTNIIYTNEVLVWTENVYHKINKLLSVESVIALLRMRFLCFAILMAWLRIQLPLYSWVKPCSHKSLVLFLEIYAFMYGRVLLTHLARRKMVVSWTWRRASTRPLVLSSYWSVSLPWWPCAPTCQSIQVRPDSFLLPWTPGFKLR